MAQSENNRQAFPVSEKFALYLIAVLGLIALSAYLRLGFELKKNPAGRSVYFKCDTGKIAPADSSRAPLSVPQNFRLNPNTATREELLRVPGIGPVTAERIIGYRTAEKNFTRIDDLLKVKGIGNKKLEKLRIYFIIKDK